jgi:predicted aspartyl protease
MAPASMLRNAGIEPFGHSSYKLANGAMREYEFALVQIEFLGEVTAGRVLFGPEDVPPLLGVTALESAGFVVDPGSQQLRRLPAIPLY